jgi:hypothetical protein
MLNSTGRRSDRRNPTPRVGPRVPLRDNAHAQRNDFVFHDASQGKTIKRVVECPLQ